jgi:hypothetical protein
MSTLYIAEAAKLGIDSQGPNIIAPQMPPLAEQKRPAACRRASTSRPRSSQSASE